MGLASLDEMNLLSIFESSRENCPTGGTASEALKLIRAWEFFWLLSRVLCTHPPDVLFDKRVSHMGAH